MGFFRVTYEGGFNAILQAKGEALATKRAREARSEEPQAVEHLTPHALWMLDEAKAALPVGARAAARRFRSRHLAELAKAARRGEAAARKADRKNAKREAERAEREAVRLEARRVALKAKRAASAKAQRAKSREARRSTTTTATRAP
ncbi:hypothetical protein [Aquincola tertiaricarbonis]|uniref:hypothetical protein n=1 Tax=Aquincola tertiaricarbonis TaxID=391953 RepID=UPI0006152BE1|nr:hypothetical protein [Aquincola tertiaricarbonis]